MSEWWEHKVKKTKKPHTCNGCKEEIPTGSEMIRFSGIFEGDFFQGKLCVPCLEYLDDNNEEFEDGWTSGDIGTARQLQEVSQ